VVLQNIIADSKNDILYRKWDVHNPKIAVLLVHGLGAHGERWEFLANYLLQHNVSSYAIELKGFGQTPTLKGHIDSFKTYYRDVYNLCLIMKSQMPEQKVFVIGESMGGLIAFLMAVRDPHIFNGLICISPAFKSIIKVSILEYMDIFSSLLYNPKKQFIMHFDSKMCTRDENYQQFMDKNPLEHRFATSKLLTNILSAQIASCTAVREIAIPVLFLLGGKDVMIDARTSEDKFKKLCVKDKMLIKYPDMYHALSIDLGREKVFQDILGWLEKRI